MAEISLYVGQSTTLSAPDVPSGAAINQTAWGCSDTHISVEKYMTYGAKVTVNSYFTGTAEVRCDYYYYWYDNAGYMHTNNGTTYFQITCNPVTLSINPTSMLLHPGEGQSISYDYSPSDVNPKPTIRFLSNNTAVAMVSSSGYVEAIGFGSASITVENSSGPNATCSVTVSDIEQTESKKTNLVVWSKEGHKVAYALSETPKLTFTETDLVIETSRVTVNYNLDNLARFTYESDEEEAIHNLETGDNTFRFDGDMLLFPSLTAGSTVSIHSLSGALIIYKTIQTAGEYTFPLSHLDKGVYMVTVNGLTYKIVKK